MNGELTMPKPEETPPRPDRPDEVTRPQRRGPHPPPPDAVDYAARDKRWPTKPQGED